MCTGTPVQHECDVRLSWHVNERAGQGGGCGECVRVNQSNMMMLSGAVGTYTSGQVREDVAASLYGFTSPL